MGITLNVLAIVGLFLHASCVASVAATSNQNDCSEVPTALRIPLSACYAQESKVVPLVAQISAVVQLFNPDKDLTATAQVQLQSPAKLEQHEMCPAKEIQLLTEELVGITRRLWQLLNRLEVPVEAQVQLLETRRTELIRHLHNLVVFTGNSPSTGMQLLSFNNEVDLLDASFTRALTLFQTERPARSNATLGSVLASIRSKSDAKKLHSLILDPRRTPAQLAELSETNPRNMSELLPQLVSNWYAESIENFDRTLQLVNALLALDHRVIGYVALHNEMRKSAHLETYELTLLVAQLKEISSLVTSTSSSTDTGSLPLAVVDQYRKLVEEVIPIYKLIGQNTKCEITNVQYLSNLSCCTANSAHLSESPDWLATIFSSNTTARALFKLSYQTEGGSTGFYSLDSLSISDSKRGLKYDNFKANFFQEWKLIPVQGGKYFKILNAQYDEVLYADKEKTSSNLQRVFLAKNTYSGPRMYEAEEALWSLACK